MQQTPSPIEQIKILYTNTNLPAALYAADGSVISKIQMISTKTINAVNKPIRYALIFIKIHLSHHSFPLELANRMLFIHKQNVNNLNFSLTNGNECAIMNKNTHSYRI